LDAWAVQMLKQQGISVHLSFFGDGEESASYWNAAMAVLDRSELPDQMTDEEVRREWEQVVQANDVMTKMDYIKVSRMGRGIRLSKAAKTALWEVFETYRDEMQSRGIKEPEDLYRDVRDLLKNKPDLAKKYRSVIVDESQDFGNAAFRMLAALVCQREDLTDSLYITGDAHQRIYGRKVVLSRCGINVKGRSRRLKVNYRTTEETCDWAVAVLKGCSVDDLDGEKDSLKGYHAAMHGAAPMVRPCESFDEEVNTIKQFIEKCREENDEAGICVVLPSNALVEKYKKELENRGLTAELLSKNSSNDAPLAIGTIHRVKGLEFDYMVIAGLSVKSFKKALQDAEGQLTMRSLVHVAATRARKNVLVTSSTAMPDWVPAS
jgi:superfamily I DNA/RNA helicase